MPMDRWIMEFSRKGIPKRAFFFLMGNLITVDDVGVPHDSGTPSMPREVVFFSWGDVFPGHFGTPAGSRKISCSCDFPEEWANLVLRHSDMYGNLVTLFLSLCADVSSLLW